MKTITAHEARILSGPSIDEQVELACKEIQNSAKNGMRSVSLRDDFYTYGGYDSKPGLH